mmetsp:Transcript_2487/g.2586  ORF Transcript_2487/g.2586 Transcript_2487/m.2586 type:complete len:248 (-) Transcript_2487:580-1323(-)
MFARPKKVAPLQKLGEVDRSFTKYAKPLIQQSSISSPKVGIANDDSSGMTFPEEDESIDSRELSAPRTGDYRSYRFSQQNEKNKNFFIDRRNARRMYRVLVCKENAAGKKLLIDSLDGKIYCEGFTYRNRQARDIVLFETKAAALSERFPSNQVAASKGGNGTLPRILVAFDAWGQCKRRLGGGPSLKCDYALAMSIVEFLDPPHPVASRLSEKYVAPNFYTKADHTSPNRERSNHWFKVNRFFDVR